MYVDTTRVQAIRAFATALALLGLVALFLTGGQLLVWEDVLWAAISLGAVVVGSVLAWWARRRVRELDASNRPFLLSEGGAEIMRARGGTERSLAVLARWLLASFLVLGVAFFFLLSAASCGNRIDGYCGSVGNPSDDVMNVAQTLAVSAGAAWAAAVSLRRTHERESERIDRVVAEGQRSRRTGHPLSGMDRHGWE